MSSMSIKSNNYFLYDFQNRYDDSVIGLKRRLIQDVRKLESIEAKRDRYGNLYISALRDIKITKKKLRKEKFKQAIDRFLLKIKGEIK